MQDYSGDLINDKNESSPFSNSQGDSSEGVESDSDKRVLESEKLRSGSDEE